MTHAGAAHGKIVISDGALHACNTTGCALEAMATCDPCSLFAPIPTGFEVDAGIDEPLPKHTKHAEDEL